MLGIALRQLGSSSRTQTLTPSAFVGDSLTNSGFDLHHIAVLAATCESHAHADNIERLHTALKMLVFSVDAQRSESGAIELSELICVCTCRASTSRQFTCRSSSIHTRGYTPSTLHGPMLPYSREKFSEVYLLMSRAASELIGTARSQSWRSAA